MRIAEVADRSGFSAATLRYYEEVDLLPPPQRTPAGYRAYDHSVLDRLAFIGRAKMLGCSLEEVAGLLPDWDGGRCAPVQGRLRGLTAAKLGEAEARRPSWWPSPPICGASSTPWVRTRPTGRATLSAAA